MRKWQVLIFFLMSAVPLRAQEEGISEYTVDDDGYVTGDYSAPVPEPLPVAGPVLVEQTPVVHRARTSVTVSLFYPFYMGSGVDFVSDYAFNPDYGGTPVSTTDCVVGFLFRRGSGRFSAADRIRVPESD